MKRLSLLSWIVRGAGSSISKKKKIKDSVSEFKVNFLYLQETKCCAWDVRSILSLWRTGDFAWADVPATGLSGGLLCVWDKTMYKLLNVELGANCLWCSLESMMDITRFHVINVYSPQELSDKKELWEKLT